MPANLAHKFTYFLLAPLTGFTGELALLKAVCEELRDQHSAYTEDTDENRCTPVGAELAIHGGDLRHRGTVVVGHDRRSWRCDCCI